MKIIKRNIKMKNQVKLKNKKLKFEFFISFETLVS
jgi:hypothetical protein